MRKLSTHEFNLVSGGATDTDDDIGFFQDSLAYLKSSETTVELLGKLAGTLIVGTVLGGGYGAYYLGKGTIEMVNEMGLVGTCLYVGAYYYL